MAVTIRLSRTGARNSPAYRVLVKDTRFPRDGRFIENVGSYDPKRQGDNFTLDLERIDYWQGQGAKVSDTVTDLIKRARAAATESV
jgi:small subunit ribosomal protein S16